MDPHNDSVIYAIQGTSSGLIKIGTSTRHEMRLASLVAQAGQDFDILAIWKGTDVEEKALHEELWRWRVGYEWFLPDDQVVGWIHTCASRSETVDHSQFLRVAQDKYLNSNWKAQLRFGQPVEQETRDLEDRVDQLEKDNENLRKAIDLFRDALIRAESSVAVAEAASQAIKVIHPHRDIPERGYNVTKNGIN